MQGDVVGELPVVAPSSRQGNVSASRPVVGTHASEARSAIETPGVAKSAALRGRRRPVAAHVQLVSATVYLLPDTLALIQQHCADTNRRISDVISEAVDDYLRKPR
jgi:hypothetical protein